MPADTQQKGFFGRSLRKLESLLDKGSNSPLALDPDLASRLDILSHVCMHSYPPADIRRKGFPHYAICAGYTHTCLTALHMLRCWL